ncbi:MAG: DUF222 domain-containing protein [Actinomycetota bacterium]
METMRAHSLVEPVEHPIDEYVRLRGEVTMLQAQCAEVLGRIDGEGLFADAGYLSAVSLVRDRTGDSWDAARRCVSEARGVAEHPYLRAAFVSGVIDRPRVAMLLAASRVSPELFARDERVLVDAVAPLPMGKAFRVIEYWKQAADRQAAAVDAEHLHRRRHLHVSRTMGGMVRLDGELDPEGGEIVITALGSLVEPANFDPSESRSGGQRRADALVELCADHLAHGDTPVSGGTRPQITLTASREVLRGEPGQPCELGDGAVVDPEVARRLACDAVVTEVMTDGSGVLDVGRSTRSIPPAIRKALIIRDQGCTHPGCGRPHRWCDAHHIIHWADGGHTSLDNLVLLCRPHHRMRHEGAVMRR